MISTLRRTSSADKLTSADRASPPPVSVIDGDVLSFYVAKLAQSLTGIPAVRLADVVTASATDRYSYPRELSLAAAPKLETLERKEHGAKSKAKRFSYS